MERDAGLRRIEKMDEEKDAYISGVEYKSERRWGKRLGFRNDRNTE